MEVAPKVNIEGGIEGNVAGLKVKEDFCRGDGQETTNLEEDLDNSGRGQNLECEGNYVRVSKEDEIGGSRGKGRSSDNWGHCHEKENPKGIDKAKNTTKKSTTLGLKSKYEC